MNDKIRLKKRNTIKVEIEDEDGNLKYDENGKVVYLEFDLEDITLLERYNKCIYLTQKATKDLNTRINLINKKQDSKGRGLLTKNQEEKVQAMKDYFKSVETAMDLFLGENGTNKIFGKTRYLTMFDDLAEMLKPILPKLKVNIENIEAKVKEKYKIGDDNILRNE